MQKLWSLFWSNHSGKPRETSDSRLRPGFVELVARRASRDAAWHTASQLLGIGKEWCELARLKSSTGRHQQLRIISSRSRDDLFERFLGDLAAGRDWKDAVSDVGSADEAEIKNLVNRQELAIGDTWAQQWMLMQLAKHLYHELEMRCLESPAATAIEKVVYDDNGNVVRWTMRPNPSQSGG